MGHGTSSQSKLPYLWMLCGTLAFALMGAGTHGLRNSCDWQVIALIRSLMALVLTAIVALAVGDQLVFWRPASLWLRSIAGSLSQVCTFYALTHLPVSDVFTLTNMVPIWVALLSWPMLGEVPTGPVWLSVASGVIGVVLIQRPQIASGELTAPLLALAASVFTAFAMLGLHQVRDVATSAVVTHFSAVSSVFCLASLFLFDRQADTAELQDGRTLLLLTAVGLSATVGQLFLTKAFGTGAPAKVSVVGLAQVVLAMALDAILFDRSFDLLTLLGIALILAPTAWLVLRRGEELPKASAA